MRHTVLAFAIVTGCSGSSELTFNIEPHLAPCSGLGSQTCMLGTDEAGETVTFYDGVAGFQFRWGQTRRITVIKHAVDDPPEDAASETLELISEEVIATSAPSDAFELRFAVGEGELVTPSIVPDRVRFSGVELACDPTVCAAVTAREDAFTLDLVFGAPAGTVATIQQRR